MAVLLGYLGGLMCSLLSARVSFTYRDQMRLKMKCPICDQDLVENPDQKYTYIEPFVAPRVFCSTHGYQPVPPPIHFKRHSKEVKGGKKQ
jgi:hypothetical protein